MQRHYDIFPPIQVPDQDFGAARDYWVASWYASSLSCQESQIDILHNQLLIIEMIILLW